MAQAQIQTAVVTYINANFAGANPGVPIYFQNQPQDRNNPPDFYVEVDIEDQGSKPIGLGIQMKTRFRGFLYVHTVSREGAGVLKAKSVLDWFSANVAYAIIPPVTFEEPVPDGSSSGRGWEYIDLKIPFYTTPL